jgi:hypothetical protein
LLLKQRANSELASYRIKAVIERHIQVKGKDVFKGSRLVQTERKSKQQLAREPKSKSVMFDINSSNLVLMETAKKDKIKVLGQTVIVENSDDEDPKMLEDLLERTDLNPKPKSVQNVLRFRKDTQS